MAHTRITVDLEYCTLTGDRLDPNPAVKGPRWEFTLTDKHTDKEGSILYDLDPLETQVTIDKHGHLNTGRLQLWLYNLVSSTIVDRHWFEIEAALKPEARIHPYQ